MRVRLRQGPDKDWIVESKRWYNIFWQYERGFYESVDSAYERAVKYAHLLKHAKIEEVK
jgi:hypothetical protein